MDATPNTRFYDAFEYLRSIRRTNVSEFCRNLNTDRPSFIKRAKTTKTIRSEWLTVLVIQYRVNADWLLTGRGKMFVKPEQLSELENHE